MARRPAIEREEVFLTANRLLEEGKSVTANTLLEALGGGSFTTIYKHLAAWQAEKPANQSVANNEVPPTVQNAIVQTWKVATEEANRIIATAKEQAAEEVQTARNQFNSAVEAIEKLEKESEDDAQAIDALKKEVFEYRDTCSKLDSDNAALRAADEELRHQLEGQTTEVERLRSDLEKARLERDLALKEAAEMKGSMATLREQNAELIKTLAGKK